MSLDNQCIYTCSCTPTNTVNFVSIPLDTIVYRVVNFHQKDYVVVLSWFCHGGLAKYLPSVK